MATGYRLAPHLMAAWQVVDKWVGLRAAPEAIMSQINPYQGIIVPSPRSQKVTPQKDRPRQDKQKPAHEQETPEEESRDAGEDGEKHLDLKA